MFVVFVFTLTLLMSVINAMAEPSQPESIKLKVLVAPFLGYAPFFIAEIRSQSPIIGFFCNAGHSRW